MNYNETTIMNALSVHKVGNKNNDDGMIVSQHGLNVDDELNRLLANYFLQPFKSNEYFNLHHD